jgi:long-chain fatty acid transport protein
MITAAMASGVLLPRLSRAGGIGLYEISTPDVGLAAAGYAARAQDASTVFKNPAGMSRLESSQFQGGLQLIYGKVEFSQDGNTGPLLAGDHNGGNAIGALPAGSLFVTHALSDRFTVGLGAFSYFGLAGEYEDGWVGRYYMQKEALLGISLMPAVSFQVTDWLALGAGLNAMYGYMDAEVKVRTLGAGDGDMTVNDEVWGFGANVGVLVEASEGTRFGLTYLSPVDLAFKDAPSFSPNLGGRGPLFDSPPELDLGLTVPQSLMLSAYHELHPKWAILANLGWQNWAQFGKVEVGVDAANPQSLTKNLNYQDTWHVAMGAQFRASEPWRLSAGVAYDSSAVEDEDRTVGLPMDEAYRFGVGAQWQVSPAITLGAAYELMWLGDLPVSQTSLFRGQLSGSFDDSWFSLFTLNLTWNF